MDRESIWSVIGVQFGLALPALVVFQMPPLTVAANMVCESRGLIGTELTAPAANPAMGPGPGSTHAGLPPVMHTRASSSSRTIAGRRREVPCCRPAVRRAALGV